MLKEKHFRMMKPTAWFINTGRGPTVDEAALITALQQGWIAGAGARRAGAASRRGRTIRYLQMKNVILSPHNASASARFDPGRKRHVGRELMLVLSGKWPMSCVNPSVLLGTKLKRWQPVLDGARAE